MMANWPYKFAILEASHIGARNPSTLLNARSYINNNLLSKKTSKFVVQCLKVLYHFIEIIL